jgi:Tfp pilus assembly protein PilF/peroxiredoxin
MSSRRNGPLAFSRRTLLKQVRWAPALLLPAPICGAALRHGSSGSKPFELAFSDSRLTPHYPQKSPLDDVLRLMVPGEDGYVSEKYAFEIGEVLNSWGRSLQAGSGSLLSPGSFLHPSIELTSLSSPQEVAAAGRGGIALLRRIFSPVTVSGLKAAAEEIHRYLSGFSRIDRTEFDVVALSGEPQSGVQTTVRYRLAGSLPGGGREQRLGEWILRWTADSSGGWKISRWQAAPENVSRAPSPLFADVTARALGSNLSYKRQLSYGVDHWRTVLDAASGIDVYGNNGVSAGDFDGDGFDDFYVCQPAGLPNRLYRNRGDGTFEDVTEHAGVGVLDSTGCAIFADFENKGLQDLLVVCDGGPLLFVNQGNGTFAVKRDAFRFARPPQGTFTHAAVADYDGDGRLDVYFCLYNYYAGLDQYRYPAPYFDARNGPPNFLLHNQGNSTFGDLTQAAGLDVDNDRYSFACAWGNHGSSGHPDLYVVNDFGRNNLYRNNGDGTFTAISKEAGVEDVGAGMSACWIDFDGDGRQDLYAANMWSAPGMRVSSDPQFHAQDPENVRELYRQHALGNSLYRNLGNGKFQNVSRKAGVAMGRWAWSSDFWDFDHDGHPDLYIANGYLSGLDTRDISSFFWRQVVGNSPSDATPVTGYERGWNAINELARSDFAWNGYERNVSYLNNQDGTFSDISGISGLDFVDDSRAFALCDIDHDGRLEVVLKNRTAPQARILRNSMAEIGNAVAFRLKGTISNRDAIGAAITVEVAGRRQTKYVQAGSGFLSQHSKEIFFGTGHDAETVGVSIRWPRGAVQSFAGVPVNRRIAIDEGAEKYSDEPFTPVAKRAPVAQAEPPAAPLETWLIQPLPAPDFSLSDINGEQVTLSSLRGSFVLLAFVTDPSLLSTAQIQALRRTRSALGKVRVLAVNVPTDREAPQGQSQFTDLPGFPVLRATEDVAGTYNIVYRHLFDRRRDLGFPTSFLIDPQNMIVKVYQGVADPQKVRSDAEHAPQTHAERLAKALPFPGKLHQGEFRRNDFTYGVAFFQHGYLDRAADSFQQVIAAMPDNAEAYYNLGTLHLQRKELDPARQNLEKAVSLKARYPEAWNNLGMVAAQGGNIEEAIQNFKQSLVIRPQFATALVNLGNLYRRKRDFDAAEQLLTQALQLQPADADVHYSLGMLYAQQGKVAIAEQYLEKAISLRPDYGDALNNLGVLFVREQRYSDAEAKFRDCIRKAPNYDQAYLNLARVYVILDQKQKAREVLQSLLRLQPQHKMAEQALEMLN